MWKTILSNPFSLRGQRHCLDSRATLLVVFWVKQYAARKLTEQEGQNNGVFLNITTFY